MKEPKKNKRSYDGKIVRVIERFETRGGKVFEVGELCRIWGVNGGVYLHSDPDGPLFRARKTARYVGWRFVELVPEDQTPPPAGGAG